MNSRIKRIILFVVIIFMCMMFIVDYEHGIQVNKQELNVEEEGKINKEEISIKPTEVIFEQVLSETIVEEPKVVSLGEFILTAYCSCVNCCGEYALNRPLDENGNEIVYGSIGVRLVAGISIAVDPRVISYGSEVIINGHTYVAHDTGGAINGNRIDVYFDDHQEALIFGVQYAEVYKVVK